MKWRSLTESIALALLITFGLPPTIRAQSPSANVTVFATGLNNPRGLKFGPDGYLYVAEGGAGGTRSTLGVCEQVPAPVGPYTGGFTSRISKIDSHGDRTTVIDNFPSSQTSPTHGNLVSGVADVAFIDHTLYALIGGAGCSHGLARTSNAIIHVRPDGKWNMVADLSTFQKTHPVANPDLADFEPDGTWYSLVAVRGELIAVEPNHQEIDRINPRTGEIHRVIDMSSLSSTWIGPTSITYRGDFFLGNLGTFPIQEGSSSIFKLTQNSPRVDTSDCCDRRDYSSRRGLRWRGLPVHSGEHHGQSLSNA